MLTSHGIWEIREGIIVTLVNSEGKIGKGEIAPIPWFGSETMEAAIDFCQQVGNTVTQTTINQIPDHLPACQFGFESALINTQSRDENQSYHYNLLNFCHLLPTGKQALKLNFSTDKNLNNSTFKWKIAVDSINQEITNLEKLFTKLPPNAKLRLDANGGLTLKEAHFWLEFTENNPIIEFIEQPLHPSQFATMVELTKSYNTALALDESVVNIHQLISCYELGWRDVFVIKPGIAGFPSLLKQFCQRNDLDLVFSSVFETDVGRQTSLKLASELGNRDRAIGFGVNHWFD